MNLALSFYWALQQELRHILRCVFMLRTWGHEQSEAKHLPPFHDHVFWVSLSVWYALTMPNSRENRTWRIVCRNGWRHLPHCKAKHLILHQKFGKHKINSLHAKDTPARSPFPMNRGPVSTSQSPACWNSAHAPHPPRAVTSGMNSFTVLVLASTHWVMLNSQRETFSLLKLVEALLLVSVMPGFHASHMTSAPHCYLLSRCMGWEAFYGIGSCCR